MCIDNFLAYIVFKRRKQARECSLGLEHILCHCANHRIPDAVATECQGAFAVIGNQAQAFVLFATRHLVCPDAADEMAVST